MIIRLEKIIIIMHKVHRNHYYQNIDHDQHDDQRKRSKSTESLKLIV